MYTWQTICMASTIKIDVNDKIILKKKLIDIYKSHLNIIKNKIHIWKLFFYIKILKKKIIIPNCKKEKKNFFFLNLIRLFWFFLSVSWLPNTSKVIVPFPKPRWSTTTTHRSFLSLFILKKKKKKTNKLERKLISHVFSTTKQSIKTNPHYRDLEVIETIRKH